MSRILVSTLRYTQRYVADVKGNTIRQEPDAGGASTSTSAFPPESSTGTRAGEEQAGGSREEDDGGYQEECKGWQYGMSVPDPCQRPSPLGSGRTLRLSTLHAARR